MLGVHFYEHALKSGSVWKRKSSDYVEEREHIILPWAYFKLGKQFIMLTLTIGKEKQFCASKLSTLIFKF